MMHLPVEGMLYFVRDRLVSFFVCSETVPWRPGVAQKRIKLRMRVHTPYTDVGPEFLTVGDWGSNSFTPEAIGVRLPTTQM